MLRDPVTEKIPKTVIESELRSAVETHTSEKGSSVPDELNRKDAHPRGGDLREPSKTEVLPDIADHVLIRSIGHGAYGEVWLGRNAVGSLHAIKVVSRKTFPDDRAFQREFEGLRKFEPISRTHPGFVAILHVGERFAEGYFYYVMELADDARTGPFIEPSTYVARTLAHEITTSQRLSLETSLPIGLSLASALAKLHEHKFIHRDIKPSNIIFVKGVPKFADIGLVTEQGKDVSDINTPPYRPPEGPGEATGDIFSLGKVFYQLFMGLPLKSFPEAPGAAEEFKTNPALQQLNHLILKACDRNPERRFQTANELREALVSVTETVHGRPPEGRLVASGEQRPKARWTRRAALIGLGGAIMGGAALWYFKRDPVLLLMDTTAPGGNYRGLDGSSNAKDITTVLQKGDLLPSSSLDEVPMDEGWFRLAYVLSKHPDLVIIHRSAFFHTVNATLKLKKVEKPLTPEEKTENAKWQAVYDECDGKLRMFIILIGTNEPRTKFLVYSRGTDTQWLEPGYQQEKWIKPLEAAFPELSGRIFTMTIPTKDKNNASFLDEDTSVPLRANVIKILKLSEKR